MVTTSGIGGGNISHMKYMSAIAQQAAQILNIQSTPSNPPTLIPSVSQATNSVIMPTVNSMSSILSTLSSNCNINLPPSTPFPVVQAQMFTKQSTLDPHLAQSSPSSLNFQLLGPHLPQT